MTDIGDLTGKQLGHFKILRKLGAGGMAVVYKAHELSLNRTVALKVIGSHLMEDPSFVERFQREAQAAARINHPNIVQIYSIGEDDGLHYFAMEYIDGKSLEKVIEEEGFVTVPKALPVVRQVASALTDAHAADVVHRDIKPANIMIDKAGRVKVADFGIAFMQTEAARLTQEGAWVGTPKYVSPEQCRGEEVDGRSDIYSLGVTLYEMLTGRAPFDADTPAGLVMQIVKGESEPIERVNPTVPGAVGELIGRMIALDPQDRFQSADDLVLEVERMEDEGLSTAAHQVHPDGEGMPPTVALGRDADADEPATEIVDTDQPATEVVDTGQAATEVAGTGAASDAGDPVTAGGEPAGEAPDDGATRPHGGAEDASPSGGADTRPHESGDGGSEATRPHAARAGSPPAQPPTSGSAESGAAAQQSSAADDEPSGATRWSRIGLAAAAVVILALLGVVFAVQMSGASRSEPAADAAAAGPVADAADPGSTEPSDEAPEASSPADPGTATPDAASPASATGADADSQADRIGEDAAGPSATDDTGDSDADEGAAGDPGSAADASASDGTAEQGDAATTGSDALAGAGQAAAPGDEGPTPAAAAARASAAAGGDAVEQQSSEAGPTGQRSAGAGAAGGQGDAGATSRVAEPEPAPSLPPPGSVVLTTSAEGGYGDLIHSLVERRLLREDFDVVDAGSFPGERMADLARVLLETSVSVTGRERVSAYGVTVDKLTVSLGIRAVSLVDGRTISTVTDTVTYTSNDAEQKFDAAVHRLMQDVVRDLRERTDG